MKRWKVKTYVIFGKKLWIEFRVFRNDGLWKIKSLFEKNVHQETRQDKLEKKNKPEKWWNGEFEF
jgi:hypothetical protein